MSTKLVRRRVIGLYVNPESHRNHTFRYAALLWEETYADGTTRVVHGEAHYGHTFHAVLTPVFDVLCAVWKAVMPAMQERDSLREVDPLTTKEAP